MKIFIVISPILSSSFGTASTLGETQTGLEPRVYRFTTPGRYRPAYCPDQMLAVILLSQHRVSSSKIVRPCAPCGARCTGHAIKTWSAVCSAGPNSQFGKGSRLHLQMDEWNRPTPVRRQLSLAKLFGASSF